jgi:hypothetical protein
VRRFLRRLLAPTVNVTMRYHIYVDRPIDADHLRAMFDEHDRELVRHIHAARVC